MDGNEVRVVVGLALADSYYSCESRIATLKYLWEDCDPEHVERVAKEFLNSPNEDCRGLGFLLQSVTQTDSPAPDLGEAKDLALDIRETQIYVIDLMYSLRLKDQTADPTAKQKISEVYPTVQKWQAQLGSSAAAIHEGDWTAAKTELNSAYVISKSLHLPDVFAEIFDLYKHTVRNLQEKTKNLRSRMQTYPSKTNIPPNRATTILQVQAVYLDLLDLQHRSITSPDIANTISYPIEKLGVAVDYLLSDETPVEDANYEIGIAATHLKRNLPRTSGSIRQALAKAANDLDVIFSKLPAKPWPVPGFGSRDVESRFSTDSQRMSRNHHHYC